MADQESQLLEQIARHPDDDSIRLAYAAWLDQEGDPRGEYVRMQVEAAQWEEGNWHRDELLSESEDLLQLHADRWLERLAPLQIEFHSLTFRRGVIHGVFVTLEWFLEHAATLFDRAPTIQAGRFMFPNAVCHLSDTILKMAVEADPTGEVMWHPRKVLGRNKPATPGQVLISALAACPQLARLRRVDVGMSGLTCNDIMAFAKSPYLHDLEELDLGLNSIGDRGLASLAGARLPRLTSLDLSSNIVGPA